jgi:ABC-type uncharacterized transport system substrate-binding protein
MSQPSLPTPSMMKPCTAPNPRQANEFRGAEGSWTVLEVQDLAMFALALTAVISSALAAGQTVILDEAQIEQYRVAAAAAKRHLPGAVELGLSDPQVAGQLATAPLVVAVGRKALALAREKTPATTPIVFSMVLGVTASDWSRNVTGVPLGVDPKAVLVGIHSLSPTFRRVGVIYNPQATDLLVVKALAAAGELGLSLTAKAVSGPAEVKAAIESLLGGIDVLWLPPDPKLFSRDLFTFLLSFAAERKLPLIGFLDAFTRAGALASLSPDYAEIGERTGQLAEQILAEPAGSRLPVPPLAFAHGKLSLNLVSADALGVSVPAVVVATAKQVYR